MNNNRFYMKRAAIVAISFFVCFLFISSVTAVSHVEGSRIMDSLKKNQRAQTLLDMIQSFQSRVHKRTSSTSLLKGTSQQGFLQVMFTLLLRLIVNLLQLTKGISIGLLNLTVILLKLTITLLIGTQKILSVAGVATFYLGIKATMGTLKFFKAATPVAARIASLIASVITPLIGATLCIAVFALSAGAAAAIFLAIPLLLMLLLQSLSGGSIIPDGSEE